MLRRVPNEHVKTGLQFAEDRILREADVLLLRSPTLGVKGRDFARDFRAEVSRDDVSSVLGGCASRKPYPGWGDALVGVWK
jgi:hypothetical protein